MDIPKRTAKALEGASRRLASEIEVASSIKRVRREIIDEVVTTIYERAVRDAVEAVSQGAAGRIP